MNTNNMAVFSKSDFYYDRSSFSLSNELKIADKCLNDNLYLWKNYHLDMSDCSGNIFFYRFSGEDAKEKREYLFTMDYLSVLLSAYKHTGNISYKEKFLQIFDMFAEYIKTEDAFTNSVELDLPVLGQILLVVKAMDILGDIPHKEEIKALFERYADWLLDEKEWITDHNHGLFQIISQLHLSLLMPDNKDSAAWRESAIRHINILYKNAYYDDYVNNEYSISYFNYNNILYKSVINFCSHYNIKGTEKIAENIDRSAEALSVFAHSDLSYPVIGDGSVIFGKGSNDRSCLFPESGMAVIKTDRLYLSFKIKTAFQAHAHTDISSITARYKNTDLIIDSGQYNYDRYTPINRFVRSSAGHSCIFPLYADELFQLDFCNRISYSEITEYHADKEKAYLKGEYTLDDIDVCREISASSNEITIKDSWKCEKPTAMRQRFVIPEALLPNSRFSVSERSLESTADNIGVKYEIFTDISNALTTVGFGAVSPQYNEYETAMLLDTIAENSLSGEITAKITFWEE